MHRHRSSLLFDLFAASQRVRTLLVEAMRDSPLAPDEYAVYSGIFEFGPITPTHLARIVGMPPTTLSHYLRDMRERRHVEEARNPLDGRSQLLTLSADGITAHRRANRFFERAYLRFVAGIDDEPRIKDALRTIEEAARAAATGAEAPAEAPVGVR